jgi:hypothetical protein
MNVKKISSIILFVILIIHFSFTVISSAPVNTFSEKTKLLSNKYTANLFNQYWGVFVPTPKIHYTIYFKTIDNNGTERNHAIRMNNSSSVERRVSSSILSSILIEVDTSLLTQNLLLAGKQPGSIEHALNYYLNNKMTPLIVKTALIECEQVGRIKKTFYIVYKW